MRRAMFVMACCAGLAVAPQAVAQGPRGGQRCGGMSSMNAGTSLSSALAMPSTASTNYASQYQSSYYQAQQAYWQGLREAEWASQALAAEAARKSQERWDRAREVVRQRRVGQESNRAARRRALAKGTDAVAQGVR